ncbi:MAG: cytochrome c oxidase assembly protein [Pseudomonadota bacterium]|nr:cytochrome c oxidase assembly protein [Pseudomonadota bacterium]
MPGWPTDRGTGAAARNARLALVCAAVFALMVGAAFAAVPFYRAFCQATGFNGTARRAAVASAVTSNHTVTVRFDTNVRGLAWRFEPAQASQIARLGESKLAFFRATNTGDKAITGRAVYNILPESAGPYFSKLECFCFKNQTLQPGETAEFPVVYFVDPRYARDKDATSSGQITLSYTFFPAVSGPAVGKQAAASAPARPSALGG